MRIVNERLHEVEQIFHRLFVYLVSVCRREQVKLAHSILVFVVKLLYALHQRHHLVSRWHGLKSDKFYHAGKVALTEVVVDVMDNLVHVRFVSCQVAHFLRHTSQDVNISFACAAAEFLYLVVCQEIFKVVGEVEIVVIESQLHTEVEGVLGCEIALEQIHRPLQLVIALLA